MKIAVDARPLASPLTGIGRYTWSLLKRMVSSDHDWFLYCDRPLTTELADTDGVRIRTGSARGGSPASLRWTQWDYVQWAKRDGIEVFWSPRHHLPLLLPSGIRQVVTIHDLVWKRYPETMIAANLWIERLLMGPSLRRAQQVICVSEFTASEVAHFYPELAGKCKVILEAAEETALRSQVTSRVVEPYLLFVGTMEPRKNLQRVIRAYALACREHDIPRLVIAGGSGWGNVNVEEEIQAQGIASRVEVLGFVEQEALQALYQDAYALLMPSIYEGFGLPVVESMRYGVPAIVGAGGALEETAGDAALAVDVLSEIEIRDAMVKLCLDKDLHRRLSENASLRSRLFDWDVAARETLQLLTR